MGTRTSIRHRPPARTKAYGAASTALRPALESPRRPARVLAVFPLGLYLEIRGDVEPFVVAVVTGEATRLPNAVVLGEALPPVVGGEEAVVGDGCVEIGGVSVQVRRWWDPAPALGPVGLDRLAPALSALEGICAASGRATGLEPGGAGTLLAEGCAQGSLVRAISAAERLMGLGPGLTPSGDDMLAGVLVALRRLGQAAGVERAVWLADWLAATVSFDARTRTTPISATLLYCAAQGQACAEALAVLRGLAGHQPLEPAVHRLLRLGHTSGADLAWGLRAGAFAVLSLGGAVTPSRSGGFTK
ncbi:DUF2877 domain-containing protein [Sphaerisporangium melleum]|uniref:DUF2877 domain-containing protein n=1 Tax=Sphaerisporangium melleum TaxID=321316 RepID=A0A917QVQ5_9ACTN|nr:DUF2877 domain-containing protein [Sphaerisporangium melleum]GGK72044.1 hypothetical protein GCM10007964_13620 [Sphaerisporangium melleum]